MIIKEILENKSENLTKNVSPNVCFNRFDLAYGKSSQLIEIIDKSFGGG